jgi:hypothetical protein
METPAAVPLYARSESSHSKSSQSVQSVKTELDNESHHSTNSNCSRRSIHMSPHKPDGKKQQFLNLALGPSDHSDPGNLLITGQDSWDESSMEGSFCDSFCDASEHSAADEEYLRRGLSIVMDLTDAFVEDLVKKSDQLVIHDGECKSEDA